MQRASISKSKSNSPRDAATDSESKRRKIDSQPRNSTPYWSGNSTPLSHFASRVMDERTAHFSSTPAQEGEDTEWVLNMSLPSPASDGSDSEDDIWSTKVAGRQTFGAFTRNKKPPVKPARDDADADLSSASEGEVSETSESRQPKAGPSRPVSKHLQRQVSDTTSPLRLHGQKQERKRKQMPAESSKRKKARKTM
jgi:hypothetical protein